MNRYSKKDVDWDFWRNMPHAMAWQACALSLNIDPDSMKRSRHDWMAGPGSAPSFEPGSFPSKDVADQFDKRLRLLSARITKFHLHSIIQGAPSHCEIYLSEFAAWAVSEMMWDGLPPELVALTQKQDKQAGAAPVTNPSDDDWMAQARAIADECFDRDTANSCRDTLKSYSKRVMEAMQERGIKGPRGIIDNANHVMREALQGKQWWANKPK